MARQSAEASRSRISFYDLVVTGCRDVPVILDDLPSDDVLLEDASRSVGIDVGVPDIVGINDDHRPVTTLIHAARVVDTNESLQSGRGRSLLEDGMNFERAIERACLPARAYKDVMPVLSHGTKILFPSNRMET